MDMTVDEAIKLCELDYELFPDDNEHLVLAVIALERQNARLIDEIPGDNEEPIEVCPTCGHIVFGKFCDDCGQRLKRKGAE